MLPDICLWLDDGIYERSELQIHRNTVSISKMKMIQKLQKDFRKIPDRYNGQRPPSPGPFGPGLGTIIFLWLWRALNINFICMMISIMNYFYHPTVPSHIFRSSKV
jgi:hypothetical protein